MGRAPAARKRGKMAMAARGIMHPAAAGCPLCLPQRDALQPGAKVGCTQVDASGLCGPQKKPDPLAEITPKGKWRGGRCKNNSAKGSQLHPWASPRAGIIPGMLSCAVMVDRQRAGKGARSEQHRDVPLSRRAACGFGRSGGSHSLWLQQQTALGSSRNELP